jgi:hypothetical protein
MRNKIGHAYVAAMAVSVTCSLLTPGARADAADTALDAFATRSHDQAIQLGPRPLLQPKVLRERAYAR